MRRQTILLPAVKVCASVSPSYGERCQLERGHKGMHGAVNGKKFRGLFHWTDTQSTEETARQVKHAIVRELLIAIGENPDREGLVDTPKRVAKSWDEIFGGYKMKVADVLSADFPACEYGGMVALDNIEFFSTCEHHMLPFFGKAHVAYIPGPRERVVGVSKLSRLVDMFAARLQIQEQLTVQIANALSTHVKAKGVAVMIEAKHFCMACRGVRKQNAVMRTCELLGVMRKPEVRAEFYAMIGRG